MRAKVQSSWRTRLLLLLAFVAAGVIAWFQVQNRERRRPAEPPTTEAPDPNIIEVEIE